MLIALPLFLLLASADIGAETVARLKAAWVFHTKAAPPSEQAARIAAFEATPVLADGTLFVTTPYSQVIALDPESGAERWRFDPELPRDRFYSEATSRGVSVRSGVAYFGTLDARLIALNARNGELLWQTYLSKLPNDGNFQITSPPVVIGDLVVTGSSVGDNSRAEMDRGTVRAFDAKTGKPRWSWDPTPQGRTGAANAWAPMAVDASRDMILVPTGSASPDFFGGMRPGANLYANCVVALRGSTGEVLWHFQVVHHDLWDYDVASQPSLIQIGGKPAVGVLTKMGHYFALDRLTGKPLLPVQERPVPGSNIEGEAASLSQPFPVSGIFTEQKFEPRPGWCEEQTRKLRYDGIFTPPSLEGSLSFPGNVGGANWGGGSYDPARGLLFVAANRLATTVRLIPRKIFDGQGHGDTGERLGQEYGSQSGAPYGVSRRTFVDEDRVPCNKPPWGALVAIDVATGKLRWEAPLSVSLGGPMNLNGVVFFTGLLFESKIQAFSAGDGRLLWESKLPFPAQSTPGTYLWKGKRYIVVCSGGHGKAGNSQGDAVIAYALQP